MFAPIKIACSYIRYRLLKWKLRTKSPVIEDLFDNDHDLCLCCGELYFKSNPKHKYCSRVCQRRHYYILNKK